MGLGAICHTLNPRLSDRDITYIAGGAGMWSQPACTQGCLLHTTAFGVFGGHPCQPYCFACGGHLLVYYSSSRDVQHGL